MESRRPSPPSPLDAQRESLTEARETMAAAQGNDAAVKAWMETIGQNSARINDQWRSAHSTYQAQMQQFDQPAPDQPAVAPPNTPKR
jgi:uncharacterized membrane protein